MAQLPVAAPLLAPAALAAAIAPWAAAAGGAGEEPGKAAAAVGEEVHTDHKMIAWEGARSGQSQAVVAFVVAAVRHRDNGHRRRRRGCPSG